MCSSADGASYSVFFVDDRVFFVGGSIVEWAGGDADLCKQTRSSIIVNSRKEQNF